MLNVKNEHAVAMGKLGGQARAKALSAKRRKEIASNAAKARWSKKKRKGKDKGSREKVSDVS